jgi:hypothetical protein
MGYSMINIAVPGTVRTSTVRITVSYDIIAAFLDQVAGKEAISTFERISSL